TQRPGNRLRLVPRRPLDRLPGFEGEARHHQRRDEKSADAAEAPASVSGLQCRLVTGFAAAAGGVAAAGPLVLSDRPVAGAGRRSETAPRSRLLARRSRESAPQRTAPAEDDIEFRNDPERREELGVT